MIHTHRITVRAVYNTGESPDSEPIVASLAINQDSSSKVAGTGRSAHSNSPLPGTQSETLETREDGVRDRSVVVWEKETCLDDKSTVPVHSNPKVVETLINGGNDNDDLGDEKADSRELATSSELQPAGHGSEGITSSPRPDGQTETPEPDGGLLLPPRIERGHKEEGNPAKDTATMASSSAPIATAEGHNTYTLSTSPTDQPNLSTSPTDQPNLSTSPTDQPNLSTSPSDQPDTSPTDQPNLSTSPSDQPDTSPTDQPNLSIFHTDQPDTSPTDQPNLSTSPSDQPDTSPTDQPNLSTSPTDQPNLSTSPSDQPNLSTSPTDQPNLSTSPTDQPNPPDTSPTDQPNPPDTGTASRSPQQTILVTLPVDTQPRHTAELHISSSNEQAETPDPPPLQTNTITPIGSVGQSLPSNDLLPGIELPIPIPPLSAKQDQPITMTDDLTTTEVSYVSLGGRPPPLGMPAAHSASLLLSQLETDLSRKE